MKKFSLSTWIPSIILGVFTILVSVILVQSYLRPYRFSKPVNRVPVTLGDGNTYLLNNSVGIVSEQGKLIFSKSRYEYLASGTYRWNGNSELKLSYWYAVPISLTLMILAMPTVIQKFMAKVRRNKNRNQSMN